MPTTAPMAVMLLLGLLLGLADMATCGEIVSAAKVLKEADESIAKIRAGTLVVLTAPNAKVKVTQLRHEFPFGTAIAHQLWGEKASADVREKYQQILKENFNHAVHENALKWYHTQRQPGEPNWKDADTVLEWCEKNGISMRGHCIYWGIEKYVNGWLKELDDKALRAELEKRAKDVTARYKGRILEYDLNNEMIHGNYYSKRFGEEITKEMFNWAKASDPNAILYVNDYSILSGGDGPKYIAHIKKLLEMGTPIGGIGCQGHFGKSVNASHVKRTLDALAQFNLPIKITEYDVDNPDDKAKAEALETFYKVCFGHPAVAGVLMWGFWEGAHWRPNAALWKKDFTPTPAAETYRRLLFKDWWTTWEGQADAAGRCEVRAFFGKHAVEAGGKRVEVELKKADGKTELTVK